MDYSKIKIVENTDDVMWFDTAKMYSPLSLPQKTNPNSVEYELKQMKTIEDTNSNQCSEIYDTPVYSKDRETKVKRDYIVDGTEARLKRRCLFGAPQTLKKQKNKSLKSTQLTGLNL
jgi:hypothetical protein